VLYYFLYRLGQFIAVSLPLGLGYRLAVFFSDIHYIFAYQDRMRVTQNLQAIFPQKNEKEIARIRIRMFRNFAKYLVDFFRFQDLDAGFVEKNIKFENLEYLDAALKKNRGVIAVTAHIGNWELAGVAVSLKGYPIWAVALSHKNKNVNDFFIRQRENKKVKVIPFGNAARTCLKALRLNHLVALVGDRDFSEKGPVIDFFAKPSIFPEGPAVLALKTKAPVIPGFMIRNSDDTFTLRFEKPVECEITGNKTEDINKIIASYKDIFEKYIRTYPDQWFMFRKFWA